MTEPTWRNRFNEAVSLAIGVAAFVVLFVWWRLRDFAAGVLLWAAIWLLAIREAWSTRKLTAEEWNNRFRRASDHPDDHPSGRCWKGEGER